MKRRYDSFEGRQADSQSRRTQEAELLWKLGEKQEALGIVEEQLKNNNEDPSLLQFAAYSYLDTGNLKKARKLTARLESAAGESREVTELKAAVAREGHQWKEAAYFYEKLLAESPENVELREGYAEVLVQQHRYVEAEKEYAGLIKDKGRPRDMIWAYREVVEKGRPFFRPEFEYTHFPEEQRVYVIREKGGFWLRNWWHMGVGMAQEIYKKGGRDAAEAIDRFLFTNMLENQVFISNFLKLTGQWNTVFYDGEDFHELNLQADFEKGPFRSQLQYDWNRLVRDPVEALSHRGREDILRSRNSFVFFDRLEAGHEVKVNWYRLNGVSNSVNGAGHLGFNVSNEVFTSLTLLEKPFFLSISYSFRDAQWNKKFETAETVIPYLEKESAHSGGLFAEYRLGTFAVIRGSVTRTSDRKRDSDSLNWFGGTDIWITDSLRISVSYEYDVGDAGVAGAGNSQFFKGAMSYFF